MARHVEARDGRALEVFVDGAEDGPLVIMHHGTPSSGMLYPPRVVDAARRGLRLVGWSRPGYGASDRLAGRSVADCAADVEAIADALGVERFYTIGGSGGGPHVLATAAQLPERVLAAAAIAAIAPWDAEGLDWLAGMGQENLDEFDAALEGGERLERFLEERRKEAIKATPEAIMKMLDTLLSDVDRRALKDDLGVFIAKETAHSLQNGVWGWYDDDVAFTRPWGFDLDSTSVPVAIWHGGQDRFVDVAHGAWLAERSPGAEAHLLPDEGHLSLAEARFGDVLDGLMAAAPA